MGLDSENKVLARFKEQVEHRFPRSRLVLFGSRARHDAEPESDMDVLVIINGPVGAEERACVSECAWEAGFEEGIVVIPITVSHEEWETGPLSSSLLALAVSKEGVAL